MITAVIFFVLQQAGYILVCVSLFLCYIFLILFAFLATSSSGPYIRVTDASLCSLEPRHLFEKAFHRLPCEFD